MARVPISNDPLQPAPVAPVYQNNDGATAAAFGALQAQSLQGASEKIGAVSNKLADEAIQGAQKRNAVSRARDLGIFQTQAQQAFQTMSTEQDMTDPKTITGFQGQLDKLRDATLQAHAGGADTDSAAMLAARIEAHRTELLGHANAVADKAQTQLVHDAIGKQLQPLTQEAYTKPGNLQDLMNRADGVVADAAPALGTIGATQATNKARQEILKSSIQSLLDTGQHEKAAQLVNEYSSLLTPDNQRFFNQHITIAQVAADRAKNQGDATLQRASIILGRDLTPTEKKVLIGLQQPYDPNKDKQETLSPSEIIAGFEKASGQKATPEQIAVAYGLSKAGPAGGGNDYGNTLHGKALKFVDDNVVEFAAGQLDPEKERRFHTFVNELQKPYDKKNEETGTFEKVTAPLSPVIAEAYARRSMQLPGGAATIPAPGQPPLAQPGQAAAPTSGQPAQPAAAAPGGQTFWALNEKHLITGPAPALGELAVRTPGLGGMLPGGDNAEARTSVELASRQLVQALQTNKNYAVKEMQGIQHDIDLRPALHDTPEAYQHRLISVDNELAAREAQALKRSDPSSGLNVSYRNEARNVANIIHEFRQRLGVPPVLSPKDAEQLPDGAQFRTKDGRIITRRRGQ